MKRPAPGKRHLTLQKAFEEFHAANPWVYDAIVRLTRELVDIGYTKVGMKMLFEVIRWEYMKTTFDPNSEFKLNNNMTSRYSRLVMQRERDLAGVFEVRRLTAL